VGRGHDVRPGTSVGERLGGEHLEGGIVVDLLAAQDTAMPVVRVLAEAHVGDPDQLRGRAPDGFERPRDHAIARHRCGAPRVLVLRNAEQDDRAHADVGEPAALLGDAIDRLLRHTRHRAYGPLDPAPGDDEERLHQLCAVDVGLADQAAQALGATQPPRPEGGEPAHSPLGIVDPARLGKEADVKCAISASASAAVVKVAASIVTGRPSSRTVAAVTGPMHASAGGAARSTSCPTSSTRLRAVELLVSVIASIVPSPTAARISAACAGSGRTIRYASTSSTTAPRSRSTRASNGRAPAARGRRNRCPSSATSPNASINPSATKVRGTRSGLMRCRSSSRAVSGPIAATRTFPSSRTSRPSLPIRSRNARTPLALVKTIQSKRLVATTAPSNPIGSADSASSIVGNKTTSAPASSRRSTKGPAWARGRVTMMRRPKSGLPSYHLSVSLSPTTVPITITEGAPIPAWRTAATRLSSVPLTVTCRPVVP